MIEKKLGWADGICDNNDHPEHHGKKCSCAGCRPQNMCIPETGGCSECDGPVDGCDRNDEDKDEDYNHKDI